MGFRMKAMIGYVAVIVILATGMGFAIGHVERLTTEQIARIRTAEHEIVLVERLRWTAEQVVATGRGFLISNHPAHLATLRQVQGEFEQRVWGLEDRLSPSGVVLLAGIAAAAHEFRRVQERFVADRMRSSEIGTLAARFEADLVPARRALSTALDLLIKFKSAVIGEVYRQSMQERATLMAWMYGLLSMLASIGIGVAWYASRRLSSSYRREQEALEISRQSVIARDDFMGMVAHDLRSPLSAIMMYAELLRTTTDDGNSRTRAQSIENIAARMAQLVSTMLDVATIEAKRFTLQLEPCRIDDLMRAVVEMFAPLAASSQVYLDVPAAQSDLVIRADRERILQVLSNLVGNAIKFTPKQGRVGLSVTAEGGDIRISVSDSGPGIAADDLPHVFDRFWKHEQRGKKGTGLGLFIATSIIDAHRGRIWVESEPGHGATVHFILGISAAGVHDGAPSPSEERPGGRDF